MRSMTVDDVLLWVVRADMFNPEYLTLVYLLYFNSRFNSVQAVVKSES
jgi:hypothetical protein